VQDTPESIIAETAFSPQESKRKLKLYNDKKKNKKVQFHLSLLKL
jgi:hypothetical protein